MQWDSHTGELPAGLLNDPPVVDVFERVTCDLLLVRAAPPTLIPAQGTVMSFTRYIQLSHWLLCLCELAAPDWVVGFV